MFKAHPRSLRPTVGYRSRFRASVGGIRIGPEDPQRQSARKRADQLELPPPNDGVEEKRHRRWIVSRWQPAHKAADAHRPNLGTQAHALSAEFDLLECSHGLLELAV